MGEAKALMWTEWYESEDDVPPTSNVMKDILAVEANAEDDLNVQEIPPFGAKTSSLVVQRFLGHTERESFVWHESDC